MHWWWCQIFKGLFAKSLKGLCQKKKCFGIKRHFPKVSLRYKVVYPQKRIFIGTSPPPLQPLDGLNWGGQQGADSPDHLELPTLMGQHKAHNPRLKALPTSRTLF